MSGSVFPPSGVDSASFCGVCMWHMNARLGRYPPMGRITALVEYAVGSAAAERCQQPRDPRCWSQSRAEGRD